MTPFPRQVDVNKHTEAMCRLYTTCISQQNLSLFVSKPTDFASPVKMAASSRVSASPTSSKSRGWFTTGKKVMSITPSKSPVNTAHNEGVYSVPPARQMKQVRKSKSEKGKLKIYASAHDLGQRNTKWHISLPNIHNVQDQNLDRSPRNPNSKSPLPPPPSNPPPVLHTVQGVKTSSPRGRELVKSVSAGAINVVTPLGSPGRNFSPQGSPPVKQAAVETEKRATEESGKPRRGPPPKLPPPYSTKARAATVISAAIQEHVQSSTRSAPGSLQNTTETEPSHQPSVSLITSGILKSENVESTLPDGSDATRPLSPAVLETTPETSNVDESPLTASTEGGVKSLARYFSARSKEGLVTSPKHSPKISRQKRGRELLRKGLMKASSIPETCTEENEFVEHKPHLPTIRSISNDPDDQYQVLHDVGSLASPGSPTHMSLFSWYHPDLASNSYREVGAPKEKDSSMSPKSPVYKEYQNVEVDTASLISEALPNTPLPKEGSHKEKKPMPLPRTLSKERGVGISRPRERNLGMSQSDGALPVPSPQSSLKSASSEYIDMIKEREPVQTTVEVDVRRAGEFPGSPDMVVLGSLDPEWRDNFEELIQREIEMTDGFSDSEEEAEDTEAHDDITEVTSSAKVVVRPAPVTKATLKKTQSHIPSGPNIQRRNTPKEKKELRKGVCSESDQLERDEYVRMNSVSHTNNTPFPSQGSSKASSEAPPPPSSPSLIVPQPPPGMDPRSSTYYLKILPTPMVKPPEESLTAKVPAPVKHFYIEIDVPDDPSEQGMVQAGPDSPGGPNLPPKPSPVHKPTNALVIEANRKRKLKYPKISVGTATENASAIEGKKARKTPYSHVKVDRQLQSGTEQNSHTPVSRQRSQGSIFAKEMLSYVHRPLPPPPSEGAVYYKTVNHPLGNVPPARRFWHHEYIEIDESELNEKNSGGPLPKPAEGWINIHAAGGPVRENERKKRSHTTLAAPPPVPQRPSCPYVEIDADEMEELALGLPLAGHSKLSLGPKTARKLGPPPTVPNRPEETICQRSFSSSGEYSYPVIPGLMFEWRMRRAGGDGKAYFTPHPSQSPAVQPPWHLASGGKKSLMETIDEKGCFFDSPPTVPPKTESLLREQKGLLSQQSAYPSPYLVPVITSVRKESSYDHLATSPEPKQSKSPKEVISNLRKELFIEETGTDTKEEKANPLPPHLVLAKKAMGPPSPPLPYQATKQRANSKHDPPKVPTKKRRASKDSTSAHSTDTKPPPESVAIRKTRLQDRIDRNSLAMIMRNKSAIAEKLEESGSPKSRRKVIQATKDKEDASVVRSLGDILLDMDALLQHQMCSEDDLIAAIEKQLSIKLVKKTTENDSRGDNGREGSGGRLDDSVQVTEQDVAEVVTFMNSSQTSSDKEEPCSKGEGLESSWTERSVRPESATPETDEFGPPKHRSSTVVITDDAPDFTPTVRMRGSAFSSEPNLQVHNVDNSEEEVEEKQIRDGRSSSVGLRPLRRVKARRRTNPASDMANLSAGK